MDRTARQEIAKSRVKAYHHVEAQRDLAEYELLTLISPVVEAEFMPARDDHALSGILISQYVYRLLTMGPSGAFANTIASILFMCSPGGLH